MKFIRRMGNTFLICWGKLIPSFSVFLPKICNGWIDEQITKRNTYLQQCAWWKIVQYSMSCNELMKSWIFFPINSSSTGSENDRPDIFPDKQLYVVLEFGHGGSDLESYVFNNARAAKAVFLQVSALSYYITLFQVKEWTRHANCLRLSLSCICQLCCQDSLLRYCLFEYFYLICILCILYCGFGFVIQRSNAIVIMWVVVKESHPLLLPIFIVRYYSNQKFLPIQRMKYWWTKYPNFLRLWYHYMYLP